MGPCHKRDRAESPRSLPSVLVQHPLGVSRTDGLLCPKGHISSTETALQYRKNNSLRGAPIGHPHTRTVTLTHDLARSLLKIHSRCALFITHHEHLRADHLTREAEVTTSLFSLCQTAGTLPITITHYTDHKPIHFRRYRCTTQLGLSSTEYHTGLTKATAEPPFSNTTDTMMKMATMRPSDLSRSRTAETATTVTYSHVSDESGSCGSYRFDDDDDEDSIHELIAATALRWKQETAHTVMRTTTGTQFPGTASALVGQQQQQRISPLDQPQHQQQQQLPFRQQATQQREGAPQHPPVPAMLAIPHSALAEVTLTKNPSFEDDALTVDTALFSSMPAARRPGHDDMPLDMPCR